MANPGEERVKSRVLPELRGLQFFVRHKCVRAVVLKVSRNSQALASVRDRTMASEKDVLVEVTSQQYG